VPPKAAAILPAVSALMAVEDTLILDDQRPGDFPPDRAPALQRSAC
jgi:hypothetical protein